MTTSITHRRDAVLHAVSVLEAAQALFAKATADLAAVCPHQPGDNATLAYLGGEPQPMHIERVSAVLHNGRVQWVLSGKKLTAAGKPHKTATALATIDVDAVATEAAQAVRRDELRNIKAQEWVIAEQDLSGNERLDLDVERGAARKLEGDAVALTGVNATERLAIRRLIDLGIENANDTVLLERNAYVSDWANLLRGTISSQLANGNYHRHTVLFFGSRGIKA